jgi:hypothetical protein
MERKILAAIAIIIGAILLIVGIVLVEDFIKAVEPIVRPFPYGFTGLVLISIGSIAFGILEWLGKDK